MPAQLRERLPGDSRAEHRRPARRAWTTTALLEVIRNLGGHDLAHWMPRSTPIDDSRPTIIFAYTIKGSGLPTEGHPQNHSSLLTERADATSWRPIWVSTSTTVGAVPAGQCRAELCAADGQPVASRRRRRPRRPPSMPADIGRTPSGTATTQAALGRVLLDLTREAPEAARRIVTVSPDVSSTTNLGGWLNKVGVWSPTERVDWFADDAETILHWREKPTGQHIELGIAETNLVGLMGELGATWSRWGQPLLPDRRALRPVRRTGARALVVRHLCGWAVDPGRHPSGVTLAPEGGAHQSITTPSIGLEQPGCVSYEPAFAIDAEWILLACLAQLGQPDGSVVLSAAVDPPGRPDTGRGADRFRRRGNAAAARSSQALTRSVAPTSPAVTLAAMGALIPEALDAADRLAAARA